MLYRFGRFQLYATEFRLLCDGQPVPLEPKALHLLLFLVARPGRLVRKQDLLNELWPGVAVTDNALTRSVTLVRRALNDDSRTPAFIETVPRVGYRFVAAVTAEAEGTESVTAEAGRTPFPAAAPPVEANAAEPVAIDSPSARSAPAPLPNEPRNGRRPSRVGRLPTVPVRILFAGAVAAAVLAATLVAARHKAATIAPADAAASHLAGAGGDSAAEAGLPAEAREQYQRGLYYYDRRNAVASTAAFRRAVELAPQYAPAWSGLSLALESKALLAGGVPGDAIPEAIAAAHRALALDPANGEAYLALGSVETGFTWQWADAEQNLRRGLAISPADATGHIWYAVLLQATGRDADAIGQARQAVRLAPLSFFMLRMQASILYFARHYDEAVQTLERAREMQPAHPDVVDNWISWADEQRGLYDGAVEHDLLFLQDRLPAAQIAALRLAYKRSGWHGYWQTRLRQMAQAPTGGCDKYFEGTALIRVGDLDRAAQALRSAADAHCFWMGMVQVDPALDPVRTTPQFARLEQSILSGAGRSPVPSSTGLQVATRR